MTDLSALLDRIERAAEPDREIDAEIGRWLGWTWGSDGFGEIDGGWYPPTDWKGAERGVGRAAERFYVLPKWSASIDAAFDLADRIMPGAQVRATNLGYATVIPTSGPTLGNRYDASSQTSARQPPALCVLGALFRAYIAHVSKQAAPPEDV